MALALTAALTFTPIATMGERWIPDEYREEVRHYADGRTTRPDVAAPPPTTAAGVEQWRDLVAAYFPPWEVNRALRVIKCESGGNPNAYNPGHGETGLFQHLPRYWKARSAAAGWAGANIYDPRANVAVAAWLWGQTGTWQHWVCQP